MTASRLKKDEIIQKAYTYIIGYITTHGYSPTVRELSKAVGYTSSSCGHRVLKLLEEKGLIQYDNSPRAIKVLGYSFVEIPMYINPNNPEADKSEYIEE